MHEILRMKKVASAATTNGMKKNNNQLNNESTICVCLCSCFSFVNALFLLTLRRVNIFIGFPILSFCFPFYQYKHKMNKKTVLCLKTHFPVGVFHLHRIWYRFGKSSGRLPFKLNFRGNSNFCSTIKWFCVKKNEILKKDTKQKHKLIFAVVNHYYEAEVVSEYVIKGNTAVLKCNIPSFVADFVRVESWIGSDGSEWSPTTDFGI